ncbi:hypothetical protein [Aquimarina brevivitae]|uniref:Uncharacterized protein n=1 Tax=Aquimarina brevivitae TaxID=323412 RepID=A0A4Q7PH54_9FLAO|nr:hypothetical protein [Aquimarina brevivitae]RZS99110.1 hypothetical protein EV197_0315 [Aquimarina brevivitae]
MIKKNEELFYLIKSLNKSEKRYFKVPHQTNPSAEYLILFAAIDAQESYDENAIKAEFKDKTFVNQLTTIKNYLKQKIMQSLRDFHAKISVEAELIDIIRNVEILYHKGLYSICLSELKRAEKKAIRTENNKLLFHILSWKLTILKSLPNIDQKTLRNLVNQQKQVLKTIKDYVDLTAAHLLPNETTKPHNKTSSLLNKTLKTSHKYQQLIAQNAIDKAKKLLEDVLKDWEDNTLMLEESFTTYFSIANDYIDLLVKQKQFREGLVQILKLKQKATQYEEQSAAFINEKLRLFTAELEIRRHLKDLHTTNETVREIKAFMQANTALVSLNYKLSLTLQFASIYLTKKNYENVLSCIDLILREDVKKQFKELLLPSLWLQLLAYYELGKNNLIKPLIPQIKKEIKKQKNIAPYEDVLFKFIRSTAPLSSAEKKPLFITLKEELQNVLHSKSIPYDIEQWINSK